MKRLHITILLMVATAAHGQSPAPADGRVERNVIYGKIEIVGPLCGKRGEE